MIEVVVFRAIMLFAIFYLLCHMLMRYKGPKL